MSGLLSVSRSSLIVLALSAGFALYVLWSARRLRTSERHTLKWLIVSGGVAGLALWRPAIDKIAEAMGIYYAPSALFFVACGALFWLVYRLSLQVAEQRRLLQRLGQEVAILSAATAAREAEAERIAAALSASAEKPQSEIRRIG